MSTKIYLASMSPRRKEILENLGLSFTTAPADIDETLPETMPADEGVVWLAVKKARTTFDIVKKTESQNWVTQNIDQIISIGADTTVVLDGCMLGKPDDRAHAIEMLKKLSGHTHQVYTGICVLSYDVKSQEIKELSDHVVSQVQFRHLTRAEIEAYVDTKEPMDKAGAYALQGIGSALVAKIEGCFSNIIGLSAPKTVMLLRKAGLSVLGVSGEFIENENDKTRV